MKNLVLEGIDEKLWKKLQYAASKRSKTISQYVIETLHKDTMKIEIPDKQKRYNDLDQLFGKWSEEEYQQISRKIENERQIDKDLWI